jgi:hypothetical protein
VAAVYCFLSSQTRSSLPQDLTPHVTPQKIEKKMLQKRNFS